MGNETCGNSKQRKLEEYLKRDTFAAKIAKDILITLYVFETLIEVENNRLEQTGMHRGQIYDLLTKINPNTSHKTYTDYKGDSSNRTTFVISDLIKHGAIMESLENSKIRPNTNLPGAINVSKTLNLTIQNVEETNDEKGEACGFSAAIRLMGDKGFQYSQPLIDLLKPLVNEIPEVLRPDVLPFVKNSLDAGLRGDEMFETALNTYEAEQEQAKGKMKKREHAHMLPGGASASSAVIVVNDSPSCFPCAKVGRGRLGQESSSSSSGGKGKVIDITKSPLPPQPKVASFLDCSGTDFM